MLGEIAITPGVFRESSFSDSVAAAVTWERLREPVLHECLVRNLYDGAWIQGLIAPGNTLQPKVKELLKKIARRLRRVPQCGSVCPADDVGWCAEAVDSAAILPLDCVVTTSATKLANGANPLVASAERLRSHEWWKGRGTSVRLHRTTDDYLATLNLLLLESRSLMFIDPHLDPEKYGYREFSQILRHCHRDAEPLTRIELHRVCYEGSGPGRQLLQPEEIERRFLETLKPQLEHMNVKVEVFVWDDFHDRYLISDLMGISVPNGFDIDSSVNNVTTWGRLSGDTRDDIQREFDPAVGRHALRHRFELIP